MTGGSEAGYRACAPFLARAAAPRALVVGGTGRLGGLLRRAWALDGGLLAVVQARSEGRGGMVLFDPLNEPESYRRAVAACDLVLHLAGPVAAPTPEDFALHGRLALAAVEALEAADAPARPLLVASSAAVYGAPTQPGQLFHETTPLAPLSPYGRAKVEMERQVMARAPGAILLRIGNVAGADALLAPRGAGMPPERELDIFADGRAPRRSYIGPRALARALARLARLAVAGGAGAALAGPINLALPGLVGMEALLAARGLPWRPRPAPETAIAEVGLDVERALALGLVEELPASAPAIIDDLQSLPEPRS